MLLKTIRSPHRAARLLIASSSWIFLPTNALSNPGISDAKSAANSVNIFSFDRSPRGPIFDTCISGFNPCQGYNLPGDFCCSAGSVCSVLAGNTTLLCCPDGQNCTLIHPITCDLSQQDPSLHPRAPIKTTALNGVLTKCGPNTCCPFGYACNGKGSCILESNQMARPPQTVPTTTVSKSSSSTATTSTAKARPTRITASRFSASTLVTVAAATFQPSVTDTSPASSKTDSNSNESAVARADDSSKGGKSTVSITGGVVGGLMGVLLIGALIWFLLFRRLHRGSSRTTLSSNSSGGSGSSSMRQRQPVDFMLPDTRKPTSKPTSSLSSFGKPVHKPLSISPPRLQGNSAVIRTDFISKLPSSREDLWPVSPASSTVGTTGVSEFQPASRVSSLSSSPSSSCQYSVSSSLLPPPLFVNRPLLHDRERDSLSSMPVRGLQVVNPGYSISHVSGNVGAKLNSTGSKARNSPAVRPSTPQQSARAATAATAGPGSVTSASKTGSPPVHLSADSARHHGHERMTTFGGLLQATNTKSEQPFVPYGTLPSPAARWH